MPRFSEFANELLGLDVDAQELTVLQMSARALVVFCFAVTLARLADRRILGHNAGFDIVLLVILGSVVSRGINGEAAFGPTLVAGALLVALHHLVATIAWRAHWFSQLVKGRPHTLVRAGSLVHDELRRARITADDLDENLRLNGGVDSPGDVAEARLERNGTISVVKAQRAEPRSAGQLR